MLCLAQISVPVSYALNPLTDSTNVTQIGFHTGVVGGWGQSQVAQLAEAFFSVEGESARVHPVFICIRGARSFIHSIPY